MATTTRYHISCTSHYSTDRHDPIISIYTLSLSHPISLLSLSLMFYSSVSIFLLILYSLLILSLKICFLPASIYSILNYAPLSPSTVVESRDVAYCVSLSPSLSLAHANQSLSSANLALLTHLVQSYDDGLIQH